MSEYYEVEYLNKGAGSWVVCSNPVSNVADAFILFGKHIQRKPALAHRIQRHVSEIIVEVPAKEDA